MTPFYRNQQYKSLIMHQHQFYKCGEILSDEATDGWHLMKLVTIPSNPSHEPKEIRILAIFERDQP